MQKKLGIKNISLGIKLVVGYGLWVIGGWKLEA
jgi:hypothetical protein